LGWVANFFYKNMFQIPKKSILDCRDQASTHFFLHNKKNPKSLVRSCRPTFRQIQ
ncbi:hypothetical protein ACJX0J_031308, partial [Zea mays]